jgi:hypothetical protein
MNAERLVLENNTYLNIVRELPKIQCMRESILENR